MTNDPESFDLADAEPEISAAESALHRLTDEVAGRIVDLAGERGLSQTVLADRLGKSKSYVSRVFAGGVNLTLRTIAEFEEALGVEVLVFPGKELEHPVPRRGVPFGQVRKEWDLAQKATSDEEARRAVLDARESAVREREVAAAAREKGLAAREKAVQARERLAGRHKVHQKTPAMLMWHLVHRDKQPWEPVHDRSALTRVMYRAQFQSVNIQPLGALVETASRAGGPPKALSNFPLLGLVAHPQATFQAFVQEEGSRPSQLQLPPPTANKEKPNRVGGHREFISEWVRMDASTVLHIAPSPTAEVENAIYA